MYSLRPHKHFNFVSAWKYGFVISAILIVLSIAGLITSFVVTGSALTLGTEFSGGTSIQVSQAGDVTEEKLIESFNSAASELGINTTISQAQTSSSASGENGFLLRTTDTDSNNTNSIMSKVEENLNINADNVTVNTISASWGSSVIWSSIIAFIISCIAILIVITFRYREPRMGVVALITLFHDMFIVIGVYAWAGMFFHMEITADVIAALLAIIGYSLYDTIVVFHRISKNASPTMRMSMKTCANQSLNEIIVRSMNTSITSIIPVFCMLILGTDTLLDFAFAMFIGMILGVYSTLAIATPVYTLWKCRQPEFARLEKKFPYVVEQSPFTKPMLKQARKDWKVENKEKLAQEAKDKKEAKAKWQEEKKKIASEKVERKKLAAANKDASKKNSASSAKTSSSKEADKKDATKETAKKQDDAPKSFDVAFGASSAKESSAEDADSAKDEPDVKDAASADKESADTEPENAVNADADASADKEDASAEDTKIENAAENAENNIDKEEDES